MFRSSVHKTAIAAFVLLASVVCAPSFAMGNSIGDSYNAFYSAERAAAALGDRERATIVVSAYERLLAVKQSKVLLQDTSTDDLVLLFRAAYIAQFYSYSPTYVRDMKLDLDEMEHRGRVGSELYVQMYQALIATRQFADAQRLVNLHRLSERVPRFRDLASADYFKRSVIEINPNGTLVRKALDIDHGVHIVVIAHPLCHFTRDAASYIKSDPMLSAIFAKHAYWIVPPEGDLNLKALTRWNESRITGAMRLIYRVNDWPELTTLDTPSFYFFKNGKLITAVIGWPAEGNTEKLEQALRSVGLH